MLYIFKIKVYLPNILPVYSYLNKNIQLIRPFQGLIFPPIFKYQQLATKLNFSLSKNLHLHITSHTTIYTQDKKLPINLDN